jgi:hypothetical protein
MTRYFCLFTQHLNTTKYRIEFKMTSTFKNLCNNFIRTILNRPNSNDLYICGSYAFTPHLFQISVSGLKKQYYVTRKQRVYHRTEKNVTVNEKSDNFLRFLAKISCLVRWDQSKLKWMLFQVNQYESNEGSFSSTRILRLIGH